MLRAEPVQSPSAPNANERLHCRLAAANARRLAPRRSVGDFDAELEHDVTMRRTERAFVEAERAAVKRDARAVPTNPDQFAAWFESLTETSRQNAEPLSSWLAHEASPEQAQWFTEQERHHDAGLEDLLALTQVNMPVCSKLELARSYFSELNHGGSPSPLQQHPTPLVDMPSARAIWEALAVDNLMVALATARHYAYQSLGALGLAEYAGPQRTRSIFSHASPWSREILAPLVANDATLAPVIAEGALMRLRLVAQRDARYLILLRQASPQVAQFEYAEESSEPCPPAFAPGAGPAVQPVRWREVSARPTY